LENCDNLRVLHIQDNGLNTAAAKELSIFILNKYSLEDIDISDMNAK
jgi:hypothetical protein